MADLALAPQQVAPPARTRRRERDTRTPVGLRVIVIAYVSLLVLVPVGAVTYRTFQPGLSKVFTALQDPDSIHAFRVTAIVAGTSVVIDTVFGIAAAILLVRYRFPGRRLLSAFIDLPVAVSPIVVGLALILIYGPSGWFGSIVKDQVINAKPGMVLATVFVSLPLVARAVVPVLEQTGLEQEHAATSLGANAVQRFLRITLPTIKIALAYGVVLSLARCVGEYGAVLVVSGNIQGVTQTVPLAIGTQADTNLDIDAAYALTFVLMLIALAAMLLGAFIRRTRRT